MVQKRKDYDSLESHALSLLLMQGYDDNEDLLLRSVFFMQPVCIWQSIFRAGLDVKSLTKQFKDSAAKEEEKEVHYYSAQQRHSHVNNH